MRVAGSLRIARHPLEFVGKGLTQSSPRRGGKKKRRESTDYTDKQGERKKNLHNMYIFLGINQKYDKN